MDRADFIVRRMIYDTRYLSANATPRDAAEQLLGRCMSDAEWAQQSELWTRNWEAVPDPLSLLERVKRVFGIRPEYCR
jgi:hypothetical protein